MLLFINVTKAFQSLKLKSSLGHDSLSKLVLIYAARELTEIFTACSSCPHTLYTLAYYPTPGALQESYLCLKNHPKNASDCMQSGAPKRSWVVSVEQY